MTRLANTDFFDSLVENHCRHLTNANNFIMVPYDQNNALAAEQIRKNLEADQRYYAEVKNNPMNYGAHRGVQQVHQIKSHPGKPFVLPRMKPSVYKRGPGVDVPLEFLVSWAQRINHRKQMVPQTPLLPAPVTNVRIYIEDLKSSNFDTNFYGNIVPSLVRYVATYCYSNTGKRLDPSTVYKLIDSDKDYVGRSERDIITKLSNLTERIDAAAFPKPTNIPSKVNYELIERLNQSDINGSNRIAARRWGMKFAYDLMKQGMDRRHVRDVVAGVDWFGKVCDQYNVPLDHVLRGFTMYLFSDTDPQTNGELEGKMEPRQRVVYINDRLSGERLQSVIAHELVHSLDTYKNLSDQLYDATPRCIDRWARDNSYLPAFKSGAQASPGKLNDMTAGIFAATPLWPDWIRRQRSEDAYAATERFVLDRNGKPRNFDEYMTQLISSLIEGRPIRKEWAYDFYSTAKAAANSGDTINLKDQRCVSQKLKDRLKNYLTRIRKSKH